MSDEIKNDPVLVEGAGQEIIVPLPGGVEVDVRVESGITGPPGRDGLTGPRGEPGSSTRIFGDFGRVRTPDELPNTGLIPADWDGPGRPASASQFEYGWSYRYEVDGNLWVFVGTGNWPEAWIEVDGGVRGPPGPEGPRGEVGPIGQTGAVGPPGVMGPRGDPGQDSTIPGPTGPMGPVGDRGPQGFAGPPGEVGPEGPIGETGPPGEQGITGDKGEQGDRGDIGPPGVKGDEGEKGETGDPGRDGSNGTDGTVWYWAPFSPPDPVGKNNDWILVASPTGGMPYDGDLYQMIGGAPSPMGNIRGPKGDKGDKGDTGEQGPQGERGETDVEGEITWTPLILEPGWVATKTAAYAVHHGFVRFTGYIQRLNWIDTGNVVIARLPFAVDGPNVFLCGGSLTGPSPSNQPLYILIQPSGDISLYSLRSDFNPQPTAIAYLMLAGISVARTPGPATELAEPFPAREFSKG